MSAVFFLWRALRSYRFRPWRSPYLRWRVETYSGVSAERVGAGEMARLVWTERRQILRFFAWLGEMRKISRV